MGSGTPEVFFKRHQKLSGTTGPVFFLRLEEASKSVQVLLNGIETVMVLTSMILR